MIGNGHNQGVSLINSGIKVTTADGDVTIDGNAASGNGVQLSGAVQVTSTGDGSLSIDGQSNGTGGSHDGINLNGAVVSSLNGSVSLTGQTAGGDGVDASNASTISSLGPGLSGPTLTINATSTGSGHGGKFFGTLISSVSAPSRSSPTVPATLERSGISTRTSTRPIRQA